MGRKPFLLLRGRAPSALIITCEHASSRLPAGFRTDPSTRWLLSTHRGLDIGVWEVVRHVSGVFGATAVGGRYSRLVIDLNRDPADATLVVSETDGRRISFNSPLDPAAVARRVGAIHAPYHTEVDRQCARRVAAGISPLLLSFHSFTPTINPRRRRFDVGVLFDDHAPLARRLGRALSAQGFSVRYNRPYSALEGLIYTVARHGSNHRLPYLELEFNQATLGSARRRASVARRAARAIADLDVPRS